MEVRLSTSQIYHFVHTSYGSKKYHFCETLGAPKKRLLIHEGKLIDVRAALIHVHTYSSAMLVDICSYFSLMVKFV